MLLFTWSYKCSRKLKERRSNLKKILSLLIAFSFIFSLAGCNKSDNADTKKETESNKTMICTKTETEDGMKTESTATITYKDNKILVVEQTEVTEMDKEMVDMSYNFGKEMAKEFSKVDGMEFTYEKVNDTTLKSTMKTDYTKLNVENLKEALGSSFDEEDFNKSKNMTLDEFQKEELEGYTCK